MFIKAFSARLDTGNSNVCVCLLFCRLTEWLFSLATRLERYSRSSQQGAAHFWGHKHTLKERSSCVYCLHFGRPRGLNVHYRTAERAGGRYLWWTWYPAALMFHPGSVALGIFAVLAIRYWTSLHVSSGLGQDTWNRITSNAPFLRSVFYTEPNHRGNTSTSCDTLKRTLQGAHRGLDDCFTEQAALHQAHM